MDTKAAGLASKDVDANEYAIVGDIVQVGHCNTTYSTFCDARLIEYLAAHPSRQRHRRSTTSHDPCLRIGLRSR